LTRATTGSDADALDGDDAADEDFDEGESCEQPLTMGSTSNAKAAKVETAVRLGTGGFDGIMA
jgi:hypothetical protein